MKQFNTMLAALLLLAAALASIAGSQGRPLHVASQAAAPDAAGNTAPFPAHAIASRR